MIKVNDLVKYYPNNRETPAVNGVSFTVEEGRFYTLLGPSGCGKTTTLRCIAGLERPSAGTIELGDAVVVSDRTFLPTHKRDIGMVFQSYAVWPHMTVFENVAFPLRVGGHRMSSSVIKERVETSLELVGLGGLEKRMATQLSGGQQQRLSLARAIVREPKVLLLDEPLSNLDAKLRERMRGELSLIQRRLNITTLFVTHDQVEALSMSDRVAVMNQGVIVQEGTPREIYHAPGDQFVASFIGSINLIRGTIGRVDEQSDEVQVRTQFGSVLCGHRSPGLDAEVGRDVIVAVRLEDVVIHRDEVHPDRSPERPNIFNATVQIGLFGGTSVDYHLDVDGCDLQARVNSRFDLRQGDRVQIELPPAACRVYAAEQLSALQADAEELEAAGVPATEPAR
jgi:iron(III) transport system ATP-binding protein